MPNPFHDGQSGKFNDGGAGGSASFQFSGIPYEGSPMPRRTGKRNPKTGKPSLMPSEKPCGRAARREGENVKCSTKVVPKKTTSTRVESFDASGNPIVESVSLTGFSLLEAVEFVWSDEGDGVHLCELPDENLVLAVVEDEDIDEDGVKGTAWMVMDSDNNLLAYGELGEGAVTDARASASKAAEAILGQFGMIMDPVEESIADLLLPLIEE